MLQTARRSVAAVVLAALGTLACQGCDRHYTDADIRYSSLEEVQRLRERDRADDSQLLLIDARPAGKFQERHIDGAVNMELARIREDAGRDPAISRHENLVVYGQNPADAFARAMTLRLMRVGYDDVKLYAGGLDEWRARGLPVQEAPPAQP